jgi:hypothetical protein
MRWRHGQGRAYAGRRENQAKRGGAYGQVCAGSPEQEAVAWFWASPDGLGLSPKRTPGLAEIKIC